MHRLTTTAAAALAVLAIAIAPARSQTADDKAALAGLSEVKVAFDLTNGNGKALLKQLEVIDETRQSLIKQGVKPEIVIAFRGPATKLVQGTVFGIALTLVVFAGAELFTSNNMTMLIGPTKNAGVSKDAQNEDTQRSEEEVQGDRDGEAAATPPDVGQAHEQVAEAEARVQ